MTITIQRTIVKGEITEGYIKVDGQRICDTLENSASPLTTGQYPLSLVKCKQHARKMILIEANTTKRGKMGKGRYALKCTRCKQKELVFTNTQMPVGCPQLKPGNGIHNRLDGSIMVGTRACLGCLLHPKDAFDALYERIRKSLERGNEVTLEITD